MAIQPVITNENGKMQIKYDIGLDSNNDGQKAVSIGLVIEADQKEIAEEVVAKVLQGANLPEWLKQIIGAK